MELRNRKLIGWKIFYGDGSTISSKSMRWIYAPQKNVQVVKMFYKSTNGIETNCHYGQEYYLLNDLLDLPLEIKTGKGIEGFKFVEIQQNALNDEEIIDSMLDG